MATDPNLTTTGYADVDGFFAIDGEPQLYTGTANVTSDWGANSKTDSQDFGLTLNAGSGVIVPLEANLGLQVRAYGKVQEGDGLATVSVICEGYYSN